MIQTVELDQSHRALGKGVSRTNQILSRETHPTQLDIVSRRFDTVRRCADQINGVRLFSSASQATYERISDIPNFRGRDESGRPVAAKSGSLICSSINNDNKK